MVIDATPLSLMKGIHGPVYGCLSGEDEAASKPLIHTVIEDRPHSVQKQPAVTFTLRSHQLGCPMWLRTLLGVLKRVL